MKPLPSPLAALAATLGIVFVATNLPLGAQDRGKQHKTSEAPFLEPAEAVAKMDIPEGFDVSIFASEPDIGEPIAFTFDGRGRIWVVENFNYINRRSHKEGEPISRIQILEDTDGDGVFDEKKLFTDKITFSSGIAVGFGGVYLGAPPNLLFIPDADGDDVPDGEPEILLDGWGIQDRHETLNSFLWGPDGWLYGCHGVFTRSLVGKPGTPDEDRLFIDAGIWRFHPVTKEFEIFARGLSNPWGFDFNDVGHGFATCCVIPHLFHVVQGGVYHKQSKPHVNPYVFEDIQTIRDHTHLSAHGGARFYLADAFPERYRNHLFMCNIHEHAVLTDVMEPTRSSYIGRHGEDFMPTNDLAWVGFSVEIGPEGGVYILDWHDTDICGNAINFPNSGRIYRILPEGRPAIDRPAIESLKDLELVALQGHANDWYVRQARVELHARAAAGELDRAAVHSALDRYFVGAPSTGKRLRALWANHVTGRFGGDRKADLVKLLSHGDEHVRAWSVQLLSENGDPGIEALTRFEEMGRGDVSPTVRLYLASALQRLPFEQRWPLLAALAQREEDVEDPNIPKVLWYGLEPMVTRHPEQALSVALEGNLPFLQESVARRMVSGSLPQTRGRGPVSPELLSSWRRIIHRYAPGFEPHDVGQGGVKELKSFRNENGFQTHPKNREVPCRLTRRVEVPAGQATTLKVRASYHPHGDWQLRVLANGKVLHDQVVNYQNVKHEWLDLEIDLTPFAGKAIDLVLENRANDWKNEFGYWRSIEIESSPVSGPSASASVKKKRPNLIFFLVDDLGQRDIGCYGSEFHETPSIDQLAKEGMRFHNAYATCHVCSPSRASILTGKYPGRTNLTEWLGGRPERDYEPLHHGEKVTALPDEEITLAETLKEHGYATANYGKAHLRVDPTTYGFDEAITGWVRSYHYPFGNDYDATLPAKDGDYYTDKLTDAALDFIERHQDQPFFVHLEHFAVHDPIQGRPDLVEKYRKKLAGMPPPEGPEFILEPNPDGPPLSEKELEDLIENDQLQAHQEARVWWVKQQQDNVEFAGMLEATDESLGRIREKLRDLGLEENTIIVFTADNGGMSASNQYRGIGHAREVLDSRFASSNLPLRGAKGWNYEGGLRVPLIVHWPGKTRPASTSEAVVTGTDYYPTLLEMMDLPALPEQHVDGKSFVPALEGKAYDRGPVYWHFPHYSNHGYQSPGGAIRSGDYKLLEYFENGTVQLFDLAKDVGERNDLAESRPEVVAELKRQLHAWRKEVDAKMPYPKTATSKPAPGARVTASSPKPQGAGAIILSENLPESVERFAPGWKVRDWGGPKMKPGLREAWSGRRPVLMTHPKNPDVPCVISTQVKVPTGRKTVLRLEVNNHPRGDWELGVRINGDEVLQQAVEGNEWRPIRVDLSQYAGRTIRLELENRPSDWQFEAGYWSGLEIVHPK